MELSYFMELVKKYPKIAEKKIEKLLAGDLKPVKTAELGKAQKI